jgi:hypothetical protein
MNKSFNAIIQKHGKDVSHLKDGVTSAFKVILTPQIGENRRATKFLEPNEFWLFSYSEGMLLKPTEGDVFTRNGKQFLIAETQFDTKLDTIKCGVYMLPFQLTYKAPVAGRTFTSGGKPIFEADLLIYGNKEEVGRSLDHWMGVNEDTEFFILPPVDNKPIKGASVSLNGKATEIDKVQPLYSSNGNFIGWRLKG